MICSDMKKGDLYYCEDCGFEIEVINECNCDHESEENTCTVVSCCGQEMNKKN